VRLHVDGRERNSSNFFRASPLCEIDDFSDAVISAHESPLEDLGMKIGS